MRHNFQGFPSRPGRIVEMLLCRHVYLESIQGSSPALTKEVYDVSRNLEQTIHGRIDCQLPTESHFVGKMRIQITLPLEAESLDRD